MQVERLACLLATRGTAALLPEGDYSAAQLDRVHRQALVLHRYYELLFQAVSGGEYYKVYDLAEQAGMVLGSTHGVWHSAVRRWSGEYTHMRMFPRGGREGNK